RREVFPVETCAAVSSGEQPERLIAAVPRRCGKKRSHCGAGSWTGKNAVKKIPPGAIERDQLTLVDRPRVVARVAIERRLGKRTGTARPGKERRHVVPVYQQTTTQVTRPRLVVGDAQHAAQPPLAIVLGIRRNLSWFQDDQVLVVDVKIQHLHLLLPYRRLVQDERRRVLRARPLGAR